MNCLLCKSEKVTLIGETKPNYPWLQVELPKFDVYDCEVCDTRFVYPNVLPDGFYEAVFKDTDLYANQLQLAKAITLDEDPPFALISRGQPYYALFEFLKGKRGLQILDVGCSYGHLVWTLGLMGHKVAGIDVSKEAVEMGKKIYGENMPLFEADIDTFIKNYTLKDIDVLIALDVIEHLSNPMGFIKNCLSLLRTRGVLFITTPNRAFYKKENMTHLKSFKLERGDIWFTDQPPVHLSLFTQKSMEYIASQLGLIARFIEFPGLADIHGEGSTLAIVFIKP